MAKMLVVVQSANPEQTVRALFDQTDYSTLPEGAKMVAATAWLIELPKCADFFATLLRSAKQLTRPYVVCEVAPGTDPISS